MSRDIISLVNTLKPGTIDAQRTIPISGCSYATVLQIRGWLPPSVGAICWFAFDNPAMSARIPIFAGATELPPSFEVCAQHSFRLDSAAWAFRRANRLATLKWGTTRKTIEDTIAEFENKAFADLPLLEKKVQEILASKTPDKEPFTVEPVPDQVHERLRPGRHPEIPGARGQVLDAHRHGIVEPYYRAYLYRFIPAGSLAFSL